MRRKLRIVTRKSQLAWAQAILVKQRILDLNPKLTVELHGISTRGDHTAQVDTHTVSEKRDFVRALEDALLNDQADIAVHSMKDLPVNPPNGLSYCSVLDRADSRDALIGAASLFDLSNDAKIGTSSLRRQASLKYFIKHGNVLPIRGNVDTRLGKLERGAFDALILAAAGLDRLGLSHRIGHRLDQKIFVPAPCQGVLAAEFRADDKLSQKLLLDLQVEHVQTAVTSEQSLVRELGLGCDVPFGAYCDIQESRCFLHCLVLDRNGTEAIQIQLAGTDPGALAKKTLEQLQRANAKQLLER